MPQCPRQFVESSRFDDNILHRKLGLTNYSDEKIGALFDELDQNADRTLNRANFIHFCHAIIFTALLSSADPLMDTTLDTAPKARESFTVQKTEVVAAPTAAPTAGAST